MSYDPLRDTFGIDDREHIYALLDRMAGEYQAGIHQDQCACNRFPATCRIGADMEADVDFVIGWMLRAGWISHERIREAVS